MWCPRIIPVLLLQKGVLVKSIGFRKHRYISEEAKMPFGVGGGFRTLEQVQDAIAAGAEKVVIGAKALRQPGFISEITGALGTSSVSVCLDIKPDFWGKQKCWIQSALQFCRCSTLMQQQGAGEIILQLVPRDGAMEGYNIPLPREVANALTIPVVALGGAGNREYLEAGFQQGGANALAGGSIFVYQSNRREVLINYPTNKTISLQ